VAGWQTMSVAEPPDAVISLQREIPETNREELRGFSLKSLEERLRRVLSGG